MTPLLPSHPADAAPTRHLGRLCPFLVGLAVLLGVGSAYAGWSTIDASGPQIGLFADSAYVDDDGEAERLEVAFSYDGQRVLRFETTDLRLDAYDLVVIPELEIASLEPALSPTAATHLLQYVQAGGVLVSFRDFPARDHALLESVFGWTGLTSGPTSLTTSLNAANAAGTPFQGGPASLPALSATGSTLITSLPSGALSLYDDGTHATVFLVPVGLGWVVSIGWDFFNAAPSGSTDGEGWLDVLLTTPELASPPRDREVGLFLGERYVDTDPGNPNAEASNMEVITRGLGIPARGFAGRDEVAEIALFADDAIVDYDPSSGNPQSEGVLLENGLLERGHDVEVFTDPSILSFIALTADAEVLVIPELEDGELLPLMDDAARSCLLSFVRGGGTLVLFGDSQGRSVDLANALLFSSIAPTTTVSSGSAQLVMPSATGTPFATGPSTLSLQSATSLLDETTLPPTARSLYATTTTNDVAAFFAPVWSGGIVWLGWDFFAAEPDGTADGGWRDVLDRALLLRGSFERDLPGKDVVVIPEIEGNDLAIELSPSSRAAIADYVSSGGRLVVGGGTRSVDLLNTVFGWSLAWVSATTPTAKLPSTVGTDFEDGPPSLPTLSLTRHLDRGSLPVGSVPLYESSGEVGLLSVDVGDGEVLYLGWDFFSATPVGVAGEEWVEILEHAVPEPNLATLLGVGSTVLALAARRRLPA